MPLNLSTNDGEFTPYIKFNAKAGRWYVRPQGAAADVEVERPLLAFDMANIRTGWLYYAEGSGPEKLWDPSPTQMAPRPPGPRKFKRGFEVMVFGNSDVPGIGKLGLREFSSTAGAAISAILQMHAKYEEGLAANPGKVPFYACTGVTAIPGAFGTNYEPVFQLRGWVERAKIPAFDEHEPRPSSATPTQADEMNPPPPQHSNGGRHVELDDEIPF
jgi:hypothetical protein